MHDYYCKNCEHIVGKWDNEYKCYNNIKYCNYTESKNTYSIDFLDCKNCNKFIGILCYDVCENCFVENEISEEENLFNCFLKYTKIISKNLNFDYCCEICNNTYYFRSQYWFFEELIFHK